MRISIFMIIIGIIIIIMTFASVRFFYDARCSARFEDGRYDWLAKSCMVNTSQGWIPEENYMVIE